MKKVIVPIVIAATIFASCSKKSSTSPIVGNWKLTQTATDANGNGVMDASEVMTDTTNTKYTFNSNGTGTASENYFGFTITANMKWTLLDNNTYLQLTIDSVGSSTVHVDNLTSSSMTLKDTTGGVISWGIFNKQ